MADTSAAEQFNQNVETLRRDLGALRDKAALRDVRSDIDDIERQVGALPGRIAAVRSRGYVLADQLDRASQEVGQRWWQARSIVQQHITTESFGLELEWRSLEAQAQQLGQMIGRPSQGSAALAQAQGTLKSLQARVDSVERSLRAGYEPLYSDVRRFDTLLDQIEWMMQQLAEASFSLASGESPIRAVKAVYEEGEKEDKNDPKGVLYLTTQRLIFEQKQDVATKKVLFITTEKQRVQKVIIDVPLERVSNAEGKKAGLMGHEDHFGVLLSPADPVAVARFHLDGQDCMIWQAQVMQVRRGELASLALA